MIAVYSRNQVPIRLTQERWEHILRRHTEMTNQKDRVFETLGEPDLLQEGTWVYCLPSDFMPNRL
jgi:hypothetical protein